VHKIFASFKPCKFQISSVLLNKNGFKTYPHKLIAIYWFPTRVLNRQSVPRRQEIGTTEHKEWFIAIAVIFMTSSSYSHTKITCLTSKSDQPLQLFYMPEAVARTAVYVFAFCRLFTKLLEAHITKHPVVG
jgi:hypothetical protein